MRPSDMSPIFIGGAGRSGTTLMRTILDSHPNICCGPEVKVLSMAGDLWGQCQTGALRDIFAEYGLAAEDVNVNFANFCYSFVAKLHATSGATRWAEKTPVNISYLEFLSAAFPLSKHVHLIRDGRDVCSSLLTMNWVDVRTGRPVPYTKDMTSAAEYWKGVIERARRFIRSHSGLAANYREVRYEELVLDTQRAVGELMDFLGEPFAPELLRHHESDHVYGALESSTEQVKRPVSPESIGRWRRDMSEQDKEDFKAVAGDLLIALGYEADENW